MARNVRTRNRSVLMGLRPEVRQAVEASAGDALRSGSGVANGSGIEEDSNSIARLKTRAAVDPAPLDPAIVSGATSRPYQGAGERIWYAQKPDETDGSSAAAVAAFDEWVGAGVVQAASDDGGRLELDILDSMVGAGVVIQATDAQQRQVRRQFPSLRFLPSASLYPQMVQVTSLNVGAPLQVPAGTGKPIIVDVTSDGAPMQGIKVRGYLPQGQFLEEFTNQQGIAELRVPKGHAAQIFVSAIPDHSHWSSMQEVDLANSGAALVEFRLEALTPKWNEAFAHRLGEIDLATSGRGVRVAVLDTGVSKHPLLDVAGGASTVIGETNGLDWDDSEGHGTLVAGIIAARGDGVTTPRGLAPACELFAYRICAHGSIRAEEAALATAIRQAVTDGCDLINISFGGTVSMLSVQRAMNFARTQGAICIVAAGNGFRKRVAYPACYPEALAVSAMGRLTSYPRESEFILSETQDFGTDQQDYVSTFTNIGDLVDFCAPGVGLVSCWLDDKVAAQRGTSFAAPLVTGLIARILSSQAGGAILQAQRNSNRADSIEKLALDSAATYGFQPFHEGYGLPG